MYQCYKCWNRPSSLIFYSSPFSTWVLLDGLKCPNADITDDEFKWEFVMSHSDPADELGIVKVISLGKRKQERLNNDRILFRKELLQLLCCTFSQLRLTGYHPWFADTGQESKLASCQVLLSACQCSYPSTCIWRSKLCKRDWGEHPAAIQLLWLRFNTRNCCCRMVSFMPQWSCLSSQLLCCSVKLNHSQWSSDFRNPLWGVFTEATVPLLKHEHHWALL